MSVRVSRARSARSAFTLLELLVAIAIIALLMALILPAIQGAGESARRLQCVNHLHNLGVAVQGYATAQQGALPPLTTELGRGDGEPVGYSWAVELLSFLESEGLHDRLRTYDGPSAAGPYAPNELPVRSVFICPDNSNHAGIPGSLSYVANAGYVRSDLWADNEDHHAEQVNWDRSCPCHPGAPENALGPPDREFAYATGVFWRKLPRGAYGAGPTDIGGGGDGTSNTFMISENREAGRYVDTTTGRIAFGISVPVDETDYAPLYICTTRRPPCVQTINCILGRRPGADEPANLILLPDFSLLDETRDHDAHINADREGTVGDHPRPSSDHSGGVNMLWCDGHVSFLSGTIDDFVYARLMSPGGTRFEQLADAAID